MRWSCTVVRTSCDDRAWSCDGRAWSCTVVRWSCDGHAQSCDGRALSGDDGCVVCGKSAFVIFVCFHDKFAKYKFNISHAEKALVSQYRPVFQVFLFFAR